MSADSVSPGAGTTDSERFLFRQCRKSFLQLWSYANPFRDQVSNQGSEGKELCDILICFGNNILLFSDKWCSIGSGPLTPTKWDRWYRRAVLSSIKQLDGAERWVRQFPSRIFVDKQCQSTIPIDFPAPDKLRIHRIAVAGGAARNCQDFYKSHSGGFIVLGPGLSDTSAGLPNVADLAPFQIPAVFNNNKITHVLNEDTLPLVLDELDTIADFTEYLTAKEKLIHETPHIVIQSEEELVGLFLGIRSGVAPALANTDTDLLMIAEGIYDDIKSKESYRKYSDANKSSYLWDYLIEHFTACAIKGDLFPGSVLSIRENEELLRFFAAKSRVHRRLLADALIDLYATCSRDRVSSRVARLPSTSETAFVFQCAPESQDWGDDYRKGRQQFLMSYCILTGYRNQDVKHVVGLTSLGENPGVDSFDMCAFFFEKWDKEAIRMGKRLEKEMLKDVTDPLQQRHLVDLDNIVAWQPSMEQEEEEEEEEGIT